MILTERVVIRPHNSLIQYYREKGYDAHCFVPLEIKIEDLSRGSHVKIECECDFCEKKFEWEFRLALTSIEKNGKLKCKECGLKEGAKKRFTNPDYKNPFKNAEIQKRIANKYKNDPEKLKEIDQKRKDSLRKKHDNENWNNQEQRKKTFLEKYGAYWNNFEKKQETCLRKYGHKNWNNQKKKAETCIRLYGEEHPFSFAWNNKRTPIRKWEKDCKLTYQSSYELDFLEHFYDRVQIENGKKFKYILKENEKTYISDFFLPEFNLIVEVKSSYTLKKNLEVNELKRLAVIEAGYNFIYVIDKQYDMLSEILSR